MCFITRADGEGFLRKRFERIVPMYWVCILGQLLLTTKMPIGFVRGTTPADILRTMLFFPSDERPILGVGWTLNFEIYFYVVFAAALFLNRKFAPVIAGCFVALVIWFGAQETGGFFARYYSHTYVHYFVGGIIIYYVWTLSKPFMPKRPAIAICSVALVFCYGSQFVQPMWPVSMNPWLPYFPAVVVLSALFLESSGVAITWKPLLLLGDASYAIHLTHMTIHFRPNPDALTMAAYLFGAATVGILVHRYIEKPLLRRVRSGNPIKEPATYTARL